MQIDSDPRPAHDEYAPYYKGYVSLVGDGNIIELLSAQIGRTSEILTSVSEKDAFFRYEPDKWSVKEVVGHLVDTERVMSFRALAFARDDHNDIAGMDQDRYVLKGEFDKCALSDLVSEFESLRRANVSFFQNIPDAAWSRGGKASGNFFTVRALAYIIAGHEIHHMNIVGDRYLAARGFGS